MDESLEQSEKLAAGGVVVQARDSDLPRVLIVHRPAYDDWSFPKGGVEKHEALEDAALREVREETGIEGRIVRKLSVSRYEYRTRKGNLRPKTVHYYLMEPLTADIKVDGREVDHAEWLDFEEAIGKLSHADDIEMLILFFIPKA